MNFDDIFPRLANMPEPVADLADLDAGVHDVTFHGETRHVERLRILGEVRRLWCLNTKRSFLPVVADCRQLRAMYLDAVSAPDIGFVRGFAELEVLRLDGATRATDFEPLAELTQLRGLSLEHFPKVRSLEPLARLRQLEALDVSGSIWTRMNVETLEPLGMLESLRFLSLTNLKPSDESLQPLTRLDRLDELRLANFYPVQEMARLSAALPNTSCDWFRPFCPLGQPCQSCGADLLMPTGKGKRVFCPRCSPKRRAKLEAEWERLRAA